MSAEGVRRVTELLGLDEFETVALGEISRDLEDMTVEGPEREQKIMDLGRLLGPKINEWIKDAT